MREATADSALEPRRVHPAARWLSAIVVSGLALAGWMYLRHQRETVKSLSAGLPPSLERVRTAVQRSVDPDAQKIEREPRPLTMDELRAAVRPEALNESRDEFAATRIAPFETHVWKLRTTVVSVRRPGDDDIYLVVETNGIRGCVEAPDPELCRDSKFYDQIKRVRMQLEKEFQIGNIATPVNREAELVGLGFLGTGGLRENGARLQPLLELKWLTSRS